MAASPRLPRPIFYDARCPAHKPSRAVSSTALGLSARLALRLADLLEKPANLNHKEMTVTCAH